MPITPEQMLALLEAPHWKTPGSTGRKTEGPVARRTEAQAAVNLTVLDHITEGRQVLARAAKLDAEGTPLAKREAAALRLGQQMSSEELMDLPETVRKQTCPSCGCYSLMPKKNRVFCINRHCGPAGIQRRWFLRDLAYARSGTPKKIGRTESPTPPRDAFDKNMICLFFAATGQLISPTTFHNMVGLYGLPRWEDPKRRAFLYSLSDALTAHAVHMLKREPVVCVDPDQDRDRPACAGLADLFFAETGYNTKRDEAAKALCEVCPLREVCLQTALVYNDSYQHGIRGGLTARERRELLKGRRPTNGDKTHCPQGHPYSGDNLRVRPNGNRICAICQQASKRKSRQRMKACN